jgi:2-C-methyl-D-erythritol 2,4-cyclodiphosphate synthase
VNLFALRIGHGFDVHRFSNEYDPRKPLMLAGIKLSEQRTLEAHSDGDVVLHAICDALLGAAARGDIGQHFPDDDPAFKGANSATLLGSVLEALRQDGWQPVNVDVTVVAQKPRLSSYRAAMRERLSLLLGLPEDCVNLKATTTERLGSIGRGEGIACHCVTLLAPAQEQAAAEADGLG